MTIFFRVQFGSISWQEFNVDLRMFGKIVLHFLAGVNSGSAGRPGTSSRAICAYETAPFLVSAIARLVCVTQGTKEPDIEIVTRGQRGGACIALVLC